MAGIWFHLNERSTHTTMPRHDYLSEAAQHRFTKDREEVPQTVRIEVVVSCVLYPPPVARELLVSALRQQSHIPNQDCCWAARRDSPDWACSGSSQLSRQYLASPVC